MVKKVALTIAVLFAVGGAGVLGFFISEYRNLKRYNEELVRVASESLTLSERNQSSVLSCMHSLNSCSTVRGIDFDWEKPVDGGGDKSQVEKKPAQPAQVAQRRGL